MQVVETFHIGRITSTVLGVYLDLVLPQARLGSLICWHDDAPIYWRRVSHREDFGPKIQEVEGSLQSTPSEAHAASTSGLASCLNTFSCINEPLNLTVLYDMSTSFSTGAR